MTSRAGRQHHTLPQPRLLERRGGFQAVKPRDYGTCEDIARRAVDEAGGAREVASLFDISEAMVYAWTDPQVRGDLSLSRALRLTRHKGVRVIAEAIASAAGGMFIPGDNAGKGASIAALGAISNSEMADLIAEILKAVGDGRVTDGEARGLLAKLDVLLHTLCAARAEVLEIIDNGGGAA